ncbi:hypothetical protein [Lysobacter humi (ex Lee et al. 2017)]
MTPTNDDWSGLDALWRTQPVDLPDLDRLRREAAAGRRRARLLSLLDIASVVLAALVVGRFVATAPAFGLREAVALGLLAAGLVFAGWTVRYRRTAVAHEGLAPRAMVAAEIRRALAARRFWRVNTRVMLGLSALLAVLALAQLAGAPGLPRGHALWITVLANLPLVAASCLWARRRERELRARVEHLEAIGRQLEA